MAGAKKSKKPLWRSKKAMAVYALIGIVLTSLGILFSTGLFQDIRKNSEIDAANEASVEVKKLVFVGKTIHHLRNKNDVRALQYEEQAANLRRLRGIYGFTLARFFEKNIRVSGKPLLYAITLQNEPDRYRGVIEIHKTNSGEVMIVGYVDQGSVAKLVDISKPVGTLYLYHKSVRDGQVPVAIPASRIIDWDYRAPHEFSEIEMD